MVANIAFVSGRESCTYYGSFWDVLIFIQQLSSNLNFLCVKDHKNGQKSHRDASFFQLFLNASTRASTGFSWETELAKWKIAQKKMPKISLPQKIANLEHVGGAVG